MGHAMYFSLGNSNSLASVDISAGYVGLEHFVPNIMVPLTYVATYCGPCLWLMAGILSVIRNTRDVVRCVQGYLHITLIFMIYFISNYYVYHIDLIRKEIAVFFGSDLIKLLVKT